MNKQRVDLLDIIFQGRNKSYGAYELRKNYHQRMKRSFILTMTLIGVAFSIPVLAAMFSHSRVIQLPPHRPYDTLIIIDQNPPPQPPHRVKKTSGTKADHIIPDIIKADSVVRKDDTVKHDFGTHDNIPGPGDLPNMDGQTGGVDTGLVTQTAPPITVVTPPVEKIMEVEEIEDNAEFPGGDKALAAYIHDHLRFTKSALNEGLQGKVVVSFIVNKNGKLSDFEIIRAVGYGMDEEVLQMMKEMPSWKSGRYHGKPVGVRYLLPIVLETTE